MITIEERIEENEKLILSNIKQYTTIVNKITDFIKLMIETNKIDDFDYDMQTNKLSNIYIKNQLSHLEHNYLSIGFFSDGEWVHMNITKKESAILSENLILLHDYYVIVSRHFGYSNHCEENLFDLIDPKRLKSRSFNL